MMMMVTNNENDIIIIEGIRYLIIAEIQLLGYPYLQDVSRLPELGSYLVKWETPEQPSIDPYANFLSINPIIRSVNQSINRIYLSIYISIDQSIYLSIRFLYQR